MLSDAANTEMERAQENNDVVEQGCDVRGWTVAGGGWRSQEERRGCVSQVASLSIESEWYGCRRTRTMMKKSCDKMTTDWGQCEKETLFNLDSTQASFFSIVWSGEILAVCVEKRSFKVTKKTCRLSPIIDNRILAALFLLQPFRRVARAVWPTCLV